MTDETPRVEQRYRLKVARQENYSGEHREWFEYFDLPDDLVKQIQKDATPLRPPPADGDVERDKLIEALTPSAATKAAYIGEIKERICQLDEDGNEQWSDHTISWDATKQIMAMILKRALANGQGEK